LFSDIYHELGKSFTDIVLLKNADRICPSKWCGKVSCHFGDFGLHKHIGSWRWEHKRKAAEPVRIGNGDAGIQGAVKALAARSGARKGIGDTQIRILETYDQGQSSYDGLTHVYNRLKDIGQPASDTSSSRGSKVLVCGIPFLYEKKLSRRNTNIIYTTFESDRLPPFWVASINRHYHYCVVPHEAVKKVFVDSGITIPISVIHQGYTRYPRRHRQQAIGKDFTVGFLGIPVNRKNVLKLYGACKRLKQKEIPGIRLAVHFAAFYEWLDKEPFEAMKADPMIKWTEGRFDSRQISDWYDKLSCYVYPSAGEGWSFTPRESLYMGLPTIISDIPVHKELVDSNYYGVIHSTEKEAADFSGHFFGNWARIDESDIAVIIKDVYRNYSHYARQAARGARWIEDKWFNEEVRHKMLGFIESL
jgi:glycosyltransferase involved in cell wall biosynthesis